MALRKIKSVFPAVREDIADLRTQRALPTQHIDQVDPFLFLNHHGPQIYPRNNNGLPFGPHPHRGFQTVTFILEGDIAHRDSGGHESVINEGGIQWMVAGRGLVHEEISSHNFMEDGGPLEILQLWVNLPARLKMTEPSYIGLQANQIPIHEISHGLGKLQLISGKWNGHHGPILPLTEMAIMTVDLKKSAEFSLSIPSEENIFFYVVRGGVSVNGSRIEKFHLADFSNEGDEISIHAESDAYILLCHARPFDEPVVSYGPFVMNTRQEIQQAILDYQAGRFS
ncbi:MAG: pirin family protein [Bdellovibrionia bacterium]